MYLVDACDYINGLLRRVAQTKDLHPLIFSFSILRLGSALSQAYIWLSPEGDGVSPWPLARFLYLMHVLLCGMPMALSTIPLFIACLLHKLIDQSFQLDLNSARIWLLALAFP